MRKMFKAVVTSRNEPWYEGYVTNAEGYRFLANAPKPIPAGLVFLPMQETCLVDLRIFFKDEEILRYHDGGWQQCEPDSIMEVAVVNAIKDEFTP